MSVEVPSYLKKLMGSSSQPPSDVDTMIAAKFNVPRISLRARKFRIIVNGEESVVGEEISLIILAVDPPGREMIKTFYESSYSPNENTPPSCTSSDGITPDAVSMNPKSANCYTCPNNVFGSATGLRGAKTKACKDSKRLWVVKPDAIGGIVYGLNVPATSLKNLSSFGMEVKRNGFPSAAIVVRLSMTDSDYPQLLFSIAGFLDSKNFDLVQSRKTSNDWRPPDVVVKPTSEPLIQIEDKTPGDLPQYVVEEPAHVPPITTDDILSKW